MSARKRFERAITVHVLHATGSPSALAQLLARLFSNAPPELATSETGAESDSAEVESLETLTPAERRVAGLLAESRSNKEIASALTIELNTVKTHITHIYRKVGVRNRGQFLEWWAKQKRDP